jgi:hypothetical protein
LVKGASNLAFEVAWVSAPSKGAKRRGRPPGTKTRQATGRMPALDELQLPSRRFTDKDELMACVRAECEWIWKAHLDERWTDRRLFAWCGCAVLP